MGADVPDSEFSWRVGPAETVRRVMESHITDETYQFDAQVSIHFTKDSDLLFCLWNWRYCYYFEDSESG